MSRERVKEEKLITPNCRSPELAQAVKNWKGFSVSMLLEKCQEGAGDTWRLISSRVPLTCNSLVCGGTESVPLLHIPLPHWSSAQPRTRLAPPGGAPGSSGVRRKGWELCCQERKRDTALGSGTQGNNKASSFLGCVLQVPVRALELQLAYISASAWFTLALFLDTCTIHGGAFYTSSQDSG